MHRQSSVETSGDTTRGRNVFIQGADKFRFESVPLSGNGLQQLRVAAQLRRAARTSAARTQLGSASYLRLDDNRDFLKTTSEVDSARLVILADLQDYGGAIGVAHFDESNRTLSTVINWDFWIGNPKHMANDRVTGTAITAISRNVVRTMTDYFQNSRNATEVIASISPADSLQRDAFHMHGYKPLEPGTEGLIQMVRNFERPRPGELVDN